MRSVGAGRHRRRGGTGPVAGDGEVDADRRPVAEHLVDLVGHPMALDRVEAAQEPGEIVDEHHDHRWLDLALDPGLRLGLLVRRARPTVASAIELGAEQADEPSLAAGLVGGDHGSDVGQAAERGQSCRSVGDRVEVAPRRWEEASQAQAHRDQGGGRAAAGHAVDEEVAPRRPPTPRALPLVVRLVGERDRHDQVRLADPGSGRTRSDRTTDRRAHRTCGPPSVGEQVVEVDPRRQGREPGGGRRGQAGDRGGLDDGIDDRPELCRIVPRGLERDELVGAEPGHRSTGAVTRDAGRGGVVDDVGRLGSVEHAERDAQVGVGADAIVDGAVGPLGGQHQVHPEAATALGHVDEGIEEAGQLRCERGELVDDDHEPGEVDRRRPAPAPRLARSPGLSPFGEVGIEVRSARPARRRTTLPPADLGVEGVEGPAGEVGVEIGHQPDGVGQVGAGIEGAAALVVDEQERDRVRSVSEGERQDQRAQELALARAGRAADEDMGAIGHQIDGERLGRRAGARSADGDTQLGRHRRRSLPGAPPAVDDRGRCDGPGEVGRGETVGQAGRRRRELGVAVAGERRHPAPRGRQGHAGGQDVTDHLRGRRLEDRRSSVLAGQLDDRRAPRGELLTRVGPDQRRASRAIGSGPEQARERPDQALRRGIGHEGQLHHAGTGGRVGRLVGEVVRQPAGEGPRVVVGGFGVHDRARRAQHLQSEIGGAVEGGDLADQPPEDRTSGHRGADDADRPPGPESGDHRDVDERCHHRLVGR